MSCCFESLRGVRALLLAGWTGRSEAQRVQATTSGFSRTASGISPTCMGSVGRVERSEVQRVRAITSGFSRTAPGIGPACAAAFRNGPTCAGAAP
jgi:hypothetical protein